MRSPSDERYPVTISNIAATATRLPLMKAMFDRI